MSRPERVAFVSLLGYHQTWWFITQEAGWSDKHYEDFLVKTLLRELFV